MVTFTWIDVVLVLFILWSVATGLRAGLARVVVGFVALIVAFMAGFWSYRLVANELTSWVSNTTLADFFGFIIVFVGVLILGAIVSAALSRIFDWVGLSWLNRLLGGVAGFARGVILVAALLDVVIAFMPSPTPEAFQHSVVVPYVSNVSSWLIGLAPHALREAFDQELDNLRRLWSTPSQKNTQTAQGFPLPTVDNRDC